MLWRLALVATAALAFTAEAADFFLNAGGPSVSGFRCDTGKFSNNANKYTGREKSLAVGGWKDVYQSHAYPSSPTGDLEYKIPVEDGSYTVFLMFGETTMTAPDKRLFTVKINGQLLNGGGFNAGGVLDVFTAGGGKKNAPFFFNAGLKASAGGFMTITLGRIPGKDNPMISGIVLKGANADAKVGSEGVDSCGSNGVVDPEKPKPGTCTPVVTGREANMFTMNVGAGSVKRINFGGDNVNYIVEDNIGVIAKAETEVIDNGQWPEPQQNYRYTRAPTITYKIPVEPGTYNVGLLFTESYFKEAGKRKFDIIINGMVKAPAFDVFAAQGGYNKPGYKGFGGIAPVGGFLTIQLKKVVENPFLNGIVIRGTGAGSKAIGGPDVGPATAKGKCEGGGGGGHGGNCDTVPAPAVSGQAPNKNYFRVNIGAGSVARVNFGGDNINYIVEDNIGLVAKPDTPVIDNGQWPEPQQSYRYTQEPTLTYKIPVGAGTYNIGLLFAESYFKEAGKRTFDVLINGKPVLKAFDVFAAQGYKKPGYKGFDGIVPVGGYLTIQLKKVVENPFLNGIVISGAGAGSKAIGGPDVGPATAKGKCGGGGGGGNCDKKNMETDFEGVHAAHAVTGDYVETDFKKQGFANVALNGLLSHSHGITNPLITKHVWTWTDSRTGKNVQKTGGSPKADFPVGSTKIKLYVEDSGCSTSEVTATVTVNSGTQAGAYCYYYDFKNQNPNTVPLPADAAANPKPQMSENVGDINFANTAGFGDLPFKGNTFAVRCQYYLDVEKAGQIQYKLLHSGPVKAFHNGELVASSDSKAANQMMLTTQKKYDTGLQQWEILYLKPKALQGKLIFQFSNGDVIPPEIVRHDSGSTLPVITSMNKNEGGEDTLMFVFGTAFVNGVMVKFGTAAAEIIGGDAGFVEVRVPAGTGVVPVTVSTSAGVSNSLPFTYGEVDYFPLKLTGDTLKKPGGGPFVLAEIAVIKYGPDGRLYCGSMKNNLHALRLNKALVVAKMFTKEIQDNWRRWILGLAFNPSDTNIKLYFSTSTVFWKQYSFIPDDAVGWKNGKIQSVTMSGPNGDFNNDVADVVTGLPVSNHDHAVVRSLL